MFLKNIKIISLFILLSLAALCFKPILSVRSAEALPYTRDLSISDIKQVFVNGELKYLDVVIENDGYAILTNFYVDIYIRSYGDYTDPDNPPEDPVPPYYGEPGDISLRGNPIGEDRTRTIRFPWSGQYGTFAVWAQVDRRRNVAEVDETNNIYGPVDVSVEEPPPPPELPDLSISSFTVSKQNPVPGEIVDVNVEVTNNANETSCGGFFIDLYDSSSSEPPAAGQLGNTALYSNGLDPGQTETYTFKTAWGIAGTHNLYTRVDADGLIEESDEGNNDAGPLVVSPAGDTINKPDLVITSITPEKKKCIPGEDVDVDITVKNQGISASGGSTVSLRYSPAPGEEGVKSAIISALGTGQSTTVTVQVSFGTSDRETLNYENILYANADHLSAVDESVECNNSGRPGIIYCVENQPPKINLLSGLFNNRFVRGTVRLSVGVQEDFSLSKMLFCIDSLSSPPLGLKGNWYCDWGTVRYRNGLHKVYMKAIDEYDLPSNIITLLLNVDNYKPKTYAPKKSVVKKGRYTRLYWKVSDSFTGGKAYVTLKIKRGRKVVKTLKIAGGRLTAINKTLYLRYKASLARGTYKFYVYAKDRAGNNQANLAGNWLVVK